MLTIVYGQKSLISQHNNSCRPEMKSLVVYYSRTGNAKFIAEKIVANIDADAEEIMDLKKRSGPIGFLSGGKDATQGKETKIGETKLSPKDYNLIIIGTPVWSSSPTPAIRTYINHNDLSGKKVAIFLTTTKQSQKALEKTKALLSNSQLIGELMLEEPLNKKEEAEKSIIEWCKTLTSS